MEKLRFEKMNEILKTEVKPAFGCTGPIGISYVAAEARDAVGGTPKRIKIVLDKDMCAKDGDVGIPATNIKGSKMAAAMGAFGGNASAKLEVLKSITPENEAKAREFAKSDKIEIIPDWDTKVIGVYMDAEVETENGIGRAITAKTHSNLVYKEANGKVLLDNHFDRLASLDETHDPISEYKIVEFYEFATKIPIQNLYWLREALEMNRALAQEMLEGCTGIGIGKSLLNRSEGNIIRKAKAITAAAAEARMAGISMPAMACATSGNVGITGSLALLSIAEDLGKSEEDLLRALAFCYYVICFTKNRIGRHSAMCACLAAASGGVAAGAALLLGGGLKEAQNAINNTIVNIFGVVCDGARFACALKLSSAVGIALEGAMLAMDGVCVPRNEGVCGVDGEASIEFMGKFAKTGMMDTDMILCKALYEKISEKNHKAE